MNRRYFFSKLASGLVAAVAPGLFIPKLIKPQWGKVPWAGPRTITTVDLAPPEREMSMLMSFRVIDTEEAKKAFQVEGVYPLAPMSLKYTITPTGIIKTMEPADEALLRASPVKTYYLGESRWSKKEMAVEVQMISNMNLGQVTEASRRLLAKDLEEAAGI